MTMHEEPAGAQEMTKNNTTSEAAAVEPPDVLQAGVLRPGPARPSRAPLLFFLGQTYATPDALALLRQYGVDPAEVLGRHGRGDWGDLDEEDKAQNEDAVERGRRVMSAYILREPDAEARPNDPRLWCITEADRSSTVILLPAEY